MNCLDLRKPSDRDLARQVGYLAARVEALIGLVNELKEKLEAKA